MASAVSRRPWHLTLLLAVAIAGPMLAIPAALLNRDEVFLQFPRLTDGLLAVQIAFALLGVAGALAVLVGRRAGLWLVLVSGAGVVATDLAYGSFAHAGVAAALTAALALSTRAHWPALR